LIEKFEIQFVIFIFNKEIFYIYRINHVESHMKKSKEIKIEIEAFIQATEDTEKAMHAIKNLVPPELQEIDFTIEKLRGVYHNPITVVRAHFTENAQQILEYVAQRLEESDKEYLFQSISKRVNEKGHFFLRFGKQELFGEKMKIKELKDTIKMKISLSRKCSIQDIKIILQEMDLIKA
jgi:hypothetical protein